eukprot:447323-Prymnesium_polylepis.1
MATVAMRVLSASAMAVKLPPAALVTPRARSLVCTAPVLPDHIEDMLEELASGEAQLFDVREPMEAGAGKLKAAQLVPLSELQQGMPPPMPIPRDKLTYVHCAAGIRVHYAAPILEKMGFERVVPLQEGYATLRAMGMPDGD